MNRKIYFSLVMLACVGSCASASGYKYYVIDPAGDKLVGTNPSDDLPLTTTCEADSQNKAKCIAMLREEYFKMEKELLEARQALKDCQKPNP